MPQTETGSTQKVFISYSRTDREACIQLCCALEKAGLEVFQDDHNIRVSDRWLTELENTLKNCHAFVLLVGKDGIQRWVGAEVQVALIRHFSPHNDAERLPIFPVLLDDAKPESLPPFLALFQADRWKPDEPLPKVLIEAIKTHAIRTDSKIVFEDCPFLGLSAFGKGHAQLFFGRRKETLDALTFLGDQQQINPDKLQQTDGTHYTRWLQIEGNSGSGKSSLVQAGMLPMIEQGTLWARTGFEHWRILGPMMPGKNPLEKLAETLEQGLIDDPEKRDSLSRLKRLTEDPRALAFTIKDFKQADSAFLLIVDQFEELFTFANESERKQFDVLLTAALKDPECPLFLINTVRADFLDRFEYLLSLQSIYNNHCKRYFLPIISTHGLQEIIEQPARLARLDVSEITTAILNDAKDETGALPLVENALLLLWQQRQDHQLSGKAYRDQGGIAGMLSQQADALLDHIEQQAPKKGKQAALELLLALTRVNDEDRNTRKRISREDAIHAAGKGDSKLGELVLRMLSGERPEGTLNTGHHQVLRLITISEEKNPQGDAQQFVDLIHETLVRARQKTDNTQKPEGYWPALYRYLEQNPDRESLRQQLSFRAKQWQANQTFRKIWGLCYSYFELKQYRKLGIRPKTREGQFLAWSKRAQVTWLLCLSSVTLYGAESIVWIQQHDLSPEMIFTLQRFRLGYAPLPPLTEKPIPAGSLDMSEQDAAFIAALGESQKHFGVPDRLIQIAQPFYLGKTEITYEQFDYYVWHQHRSGYPEIAFPNTAKGGRGNQPVVNVGWLDAIAYAHWLSKQTKNQCRLPTEAEWEYAARARTSTAYPWGNALGSNNANCAGCGSSWDNKEAAPVGSFVANKFGLHDMLGNVWEWTCSNWRERFDGSEQHCNDDTANKQQARVLRGGSWFNHPDLVRASARGDAHMDNRNGIVGFRVPGSGFRVLCSSPIE